MTKKFGQVVKVWSQYGSFLVKRRRLDAARNLLQRSLKVLTSKQDRKYIPGIRVVQEAEPYAVRLPNTCPLPVIKPGDEGSA
jgi:hypothetical protein